MTNLYLHYRATSGDPWTDAPSLTTVFPSVPVGALPVASVTIETGPQLETPCGCPGSTDDSYLLLKVQCAPIPLSQTTAIMNFLLNFKTMALHEAKMSGFAQGAFVSSSITLIRLKELNGMMHLSFRLAAVISDALL